MVHCVIQTGREKQLISKSSCEPTCIEINYICKDFWDADVKVRRMLSNYCSHYFSKNQQTLECIPSLLDFLGFLSIYVRVTDLNLIYLKFDVQMNFYHFQIK